jgi:hypothetical protein
MAAAGTAGAAAQQQARGELAHGFVVAGSPIPSLPNGTVFVAAPESEWWDGRPVYKATTAAGSRGADVTLFWGRKTDMWVFTPAYFNLSAAQKTGGGYGVARCPSTAGGQVPVGGTAGAAVPSWRCYVEKKWQDRRLTLRPLASAAEQVAAEAAAAAAAANEAAAQQQARGELADGFVLAGSPIPSLPDGTVFVPAPESEWWDGRPVYTAAGWGALFWGRKNDTWVFAGTYTTLTAAQKEEGGPDSGVACSLQSSAAGGRVPVGPARTWHCLISAGNWQDHPLTVRGVKEKSAAKKIAIRSRRDAARDAIRGKDAAALKKALTLPDASGLEIDIGKDVFAGVLNLLAKDWAGGGLLAAALEAGVDPNTADQNGRTLLHEAAVLDDVNLARLLLDWGAVLDPQSSSGRTPLHDGANNGNDGQSAVLKLLLDKGAKTTIIDAEGKTPLILAVEGPRTSAAIFLVEAGASVAAKRRDGKRVLDILDNAAKYQPESRKLATAIRDMLSLQSLDKFFGASRTEWINENCGVREPMLKLAAPCFDGDPPAAGNPNVERMRVGQWDVVSDTYFDHGVNSGAPHPALYTALAYAAAAVGVNVVCNPDDVKEQLDAYETVLSTTCGAFGPGGGEPAPEPETGAGAGSTVHPVSPLYFLAHARYAALIADDSRRLFLLVHFEKCFPHLAKSVDTTGWLDSDEVAALQRIKDKAADDVKLQTTKSDGPARRGPTLTDTPQGPADDSIDAQWDQIKGQLNAAQREPMEELLALTGLAEVKEVALEIYEGVLGEQKLIQNGRERSVGEGSLNFVFMGNPGTGKSTVGRLFAKLLAAAGARPGHKFIEMNASKALRMGASAFANELGSLTGGEKGVAPPPTELREGMAVEVLVGERKSKSQRNDDCWYPATVLFVHEDGKVDVKYSNGEISKKLDDDAFKKVRPLAQAGQQVGGALFLDEAYDLEPATNSVGATILNDIMEAAEKHRDKVTIIMAGYRDDIERKLYDYNPGVASRFRDVPFADFDYDQLHEIFCGFVKEHDVRTEPKVAEVGARRVARQIGTKGFGNARAVRKLFEVAQTRATQSYYRAPGRGQLEMTVEHVIGKRPDEANIPELCKALAELHAKTGLAKVKEEVDQLVSLAQNNWDQEVGQCPLMFAPAILFFFEKSRTKLLFFLSGAWRRHRPGATQPPVSREPWNWEDDHSLAVRTDSRGDRTDQQGRGDRQES